MILCEVDDAIVSAAKKDGDILVTISALTPDGHLVGVDFQCDTLNMEYPECHLLMAWRHLKNVLADKDGKYAAHTRIQT